MSKFPKKFWQDKSPADKKNQKRLHCVASDGNVGYSTSNAPADSLSSTSEASRLWFVQNESSLQHADAMSLEVGRRVVYSSNPEVTCASESITHSCAQIERELNPMLMPRHVAIIMDGNSRWAEKRGLEPSSGHEAGLQALKNVVGLSRRWGIQVLTVFALSTENWLRPKMELDFLMNLIERGLQDELSNFQKEKICIRFIGNLSMLPESLQSLIAFVERSTWYNEGLKLIVALSYSGRQDILQACQLLVAQAIDGLIKPEDITESMIDDKLLTTLVGEMRNPDLLIRTSGERRLSNFLLWQMAYTEFYFVDAFWPDFGELDYKKALLSFQSRKRRYGSRL
ncbi:hypothetical protein O6H91_10G080200 [Diphasiastrum complanatum]|uniref:Uncharacterized protein n=1 Tax=Diphasiastrum complanatum TaxID=34168 RepID=A0ACC2CIN9_DIPCM|nr:hypothetical protein O6H91_10G080200 [Diphasiastrum complanatum]